MNLRSLTTTQYDELLEFYRHHRHDKSYGDNTNILIHAVDSAFRVVRVETACGIGQFGTLLTQLLREHPTLWLYAMGWDKHADAVPVHVAHFCVRSRSFPDTGPQIDEAEVRRRYGALAPSLLQDWSSDTYLARYGPQDDLAMRDQLQSRLSIDADIKPRGKNAVMVQFSTEWLIEVPLQRELRQKLGVSPPGRAPELAGVEAAATPQESSRMTGGQSAMVPPVVGASPMCAEDSSARAVPATRTLSNVPISACPPAASAELADATTPVGAVPVPPTNTNVQVATAVAQSRGRKTIERSAQRRLAGLSRGKSAYTFTTRLYDAPVHYFSRIPREIVDEDGTIVDLEAVILDPRNFADRKEQIVLLHVLRALNKHYAGKGSQTGHNFISLKQIEELTGMDRRTITKRLERLRDRNILTEIDIITRPNGGMPQLCLGLRLPVSDWLGLNGTSC